MALQYGPEMKKETEPPATSKSESTESIVIVDYKRERQNARGAGQSHTQGCCLQIASLNDRFES